MKKFVSLTLAVLMVLSLLSGCGGSSMAKDAAAPAARQEMSDRAYRLWETQYDAQRNAEAFIAEIQKLLQ